MQAIVFATGGRRPTRQADESWIGRVGWRLPGETLPADAEGVPMQPLAMFSLAGLPWRPDALRGAGLLSVFVSPNIWEHLVGDAFDGYFCVRIHAGGVPLEPCEWTGELAVPFPLEPELIRDDPDGDDDRRYGHKLGGWPTFIQSDGEPDDAGRFVFQIASDAKARLNIVDNGCFYFFHGDGKWTLRCEFF